MKKISTLLVSALFAGGAFAQAPSNAVGLYRTQIESDYFSVLKTATVGGVQVSQIMGTTTSTVDLDNDEVYGESTEQPRYMGANVELEEGVGRIYPAEELSEKSESSYIGFKMSVPDGKTVNIDKLVAQGFFGNAFKWCADIVKDGQIIYTTDQLKVNNYNREYVWADAITVTNEAIGGLSDAAIAQIQSYVDQGWTEGITDPYEYAFSKGDSKAWGNLLTDAVKNLSGDIEVRLYYWAKSKKAMALANLYVEVSGIEESSDAPSATAAGLYRTQIESDYFSVLKTATACGVQISQIMGTTTSTVDLDNDEVYGESTEQPRYMGANVELEEGVGRIYPAEELSEKSESSYIGFKMTVPEGKTVNIDKLVAQGFFGNAFKWCADIIKDGQIIYTTDQLKVNNYNREYVWADAITVTNEAIGGLSDAAIAQIQSYVDQGWTEGITDPYEYAFSKGDSKAWGNLLTDAVKNLSGDIEVRLYYWAKAKKAMALGNLYVELSESTDGISSITTNNAVNNGAIYNLAGQRIAAPVKGQIYIQNGKKFVQK